MQPGFHMPSKKARIYAYEPEMLFMETFGSLAPLETQ